MFTKHEPRFALPISLVLAFFIPALFISPSLAAAGDGSLSSPYSVSQAIANQDSTIKTVSGYVTGQPASANTIVTGSYPDDYALALADSSSKTNISNMVYVQIPSSFRSEFGLKTHPSLKGKKVTVTGTLNAYFTHPGLKDVSAMFSGNDSPEPETPGVGSYYDSAFGKSASSLKNALREIIDDHSEISYSNGWEALRKTDEDPNNANNVILLYTGRSQGKTMNGSGVS